MRERDKGYIYSRLHNKKRCFPLSGQIELTYRCGLDCIHCYCKGSEDINGELSTGQWKEVLDTIQGEGCIWLTLTGGDPLIRGDFLEIYSYAKAKGFIITIFTSGSLLKKKVLDHLIKSPPTRVEISLYGVTEATHDGIAGVDGSFSKVVRNIRALKKNGIPLLLKTVCMKQNIGEIGRIKAFAEELLGRPSGKKFLFRYDTHIFPRLNGDKAPCRCRLSFDEILEVKKQDPDLWRDYEDYLSNKIPDFERDKEFLYHCDAWLTSFFIDPYGRLKFCQLSDKFSVDLRTTTFRDGFYDVFPGVLKAKFKTPSKCRDCDIRLVCRNCPPMAALETGSEEEPVEYYCDLAKRIARHKRMGRVVN